MTDKPEYRIGDLVWHRETRNGRVWWPAMVTYEPNIGIYFRTVNKAVQYHVQFFGASPMRGWVTSKAIKVLSAANEIPLPEKGVSKKLMKEYSVALAEVKEAIKVDHKQRKLQFIFNFDSDKKRVPPPQKEATKSVQSRRSIEPSEATKSVQRKHSREATKSVQRNRSIEPREATKCVQRKRSRESSEATKCVQRKRSRESSEATKRIVRKQPKITDGGQDPSPTETPAATQAREMGRTTIEAPQTRTVTQAQGMGHTTIEAPRTHTATQAQEMGRTTIEAPRTRTATQAQGMGRTTIEAPRTRTATQAQEMGRTTIEAPRTRTVTQAQEMCRTTFEAPRTQIAIEAQGMGRTTMETPQIQEPLPSSASHPHSIENIVRQPHIPSQPMNIAMSPPLHSVLPYPTSPPLPMVPFIPMGSPPFVPFPSFPMSPSCTGSVYPMEYYPTLMPYQYDALSVSYYSPSYLMPSLPQAMPPQPMPPQPLLHPMNMFEQPSIQQPPNITEAMSTEPPVLQQPIKLPSKPANQRIKSEAAPLSPQAPVVSVESPVLLTPPCSGPVLLTPPSSGSEELTDTDTMDAPQATNQLQGVCAICDEDGTDMLVCNGHCANMFHIDCLGLMAAPLFKFVCDECLMDTGKCFVCSQPGELVKCSKSKCPKLYHLSCINNNKLFVFDERKKKFTCPLHTCGRCASIGVPDPPSTNLVQCTKCPLALHKSHCLIAGCELLSSTNMVCYQHLKVTKNERLYSHINLNTCMDCGKIGSLFCCDVCSAAYHDGCLEPEYRPSPDQETWKCPSCLVHDLPTYGALVLCKFGMWRWWPAVVVAPEKVPDNIEARSAGECMFVVRFCGTKDYTWMHHGRAVPYTGATHDYRGSSTKQKAFKKALEEAEELYRTKRLEKEEREARVKKPDSKRYIKIKANKYLVPRPAVKETSLFCLPCQCTSDQSCNDDSSCVNRASLIECDPHTCPVGPLCKNQRLANCQEANSTPFHTGQRGWGLRIDQDLSPGDFVVEYIGEVLDTAMCRERLEKYHKNSMVNYYMLTLDGGLVIDASQKSNHARFINHSCDPNCESQKWTVNGETRIGIFACVSIKAGTELTFDYHLDSLGNEKKPCFCGSKNCSGFMGLKSVKVTTSDKPKKPVKRKRQKRRRKVLKDDVLDTHEDDCFVCGDGGELLMCDAKLCTKSYHLQCLQRKVKPSQYTFWTCPRHFCQVCQKEAAVFCSSCPMSYCKKHCDGRLEGPLCVTNCVGRIVLAGDSSDTIQQ